MNLAVLVGRYWWQGFFTGIVVGIAIETGIIALVALAAMLE